METLTTITQWMEEFSTANPYCDVTIICLVILGGYFARRNLTELPYSLTYTTLLTGTAFSLIYLLLLHLTGREVDLVKAFVSYCVATSCYDLIVKQVEGFMQKRNKN